MSRVYYIAKENETKSIDLSSLPNWSNIAKGSHKITIIAKANGYIDSKPSKQSIVTKL